MERAPRSVESIVEEQVKRWQAERARQAAASAVPPPVVAVSRQYGARGAAVAHAVAERLGFSYWNREIVEEIARHAHVSDHLVRAFDEHHRAAIVEAVRSVMVGGALSGSEYFRELAHVVHGIAAHGRAVLVGRGIQFLLQPARALRVRVVAPLEVRVAGLVERRGLGEAAAQLEIATTDADRRAFTRDHYGREVDDPGAYDLQVNTGTLSIAGAADVVAAAYRARFGEDRNLQSTAGGSATG
jgi:cytidylate kinase